MSKTCAKQADMEAALRRAIAEPTIYERAAFVKGWKAAQTAPVNVPEWFKLVDERELLKIKHALESCDAGDYSTGSVIHPSYDEKAVEDALNSVTVMLSAAPSAPIAAPSEDAKRLDWLEAQGDPNLSWLARHSVTGRGYRLHQSTHAGFATPREAIDAAIAATAQQKEGE